MWYSSEWKDFSVIDASGGERLETWGKYTLIRPDPQVVWNGDRQDKRWRCADAIYRRSKSGGGEWGANNLPDSWTIAYKNLTFRVKPMGFKHMGIFPEQAANWDWCSELIKSAGRKIKVLNLFAYTGGATVSAAAAGASVCHVDASKGMVAMAKENAYLSGLGSAPIRYIVDDCRKFAEREIRRGNKYDAIIMDPPSYGRGPTGEVWKIEDEIDGFVDLISHLLSDEPLFFLLNSYTTGLSPCTMECITKLRMPLRGTSKVESGELALPIKSNGLYLPCGSSVRVIF